MVRRFSMAFVFVLMFVILPLTADAALVKNLNTGVDGSGVKLANYSSDTNWVFGAGSTSFAGLNPQAISGPLPDQWVTDAASTTSRWISYHTGQGFADGLAAPLGTYYYVTTVDLTGYVPSSAAINGRFMADNDLTNILINNVGTGATATNQFTSFQNLPTNLGLGLFSSGVNTITFQVQNTILATSAQGLRLEAAVTANAVPEPSSLVLLAGGAVLVMRTSRGRYLKRRSGVK